MNDNINEKQNRDKMTEDIKGVMDRFFKKAREAEQTVYTDFDGKEYRECAGAYNDWLVRAMCRDMSRLWIHLKISGNSLEGEVSGWAEKMERLNFAILRQMDDFNGDRPLVPVIEEGQDDIVEDLLKGMGKVKKSGKLDSDKWLQEKDICGKMDMWVRRVLYITFWMYYMEQMRDIEDKLFDSQIKYYDSDDNLISGLDDSDINFIKTVCEMRRLLLAAFLRISVKDDESSALLEKLNWLDILTQAAMEGKLESLAELVKKNGK